MDGEEGSRAPKRARVAAEEGSKPSSIPSCSVKPDLQVIVEDETFEVHSLLLMLASPVFNNMLMAGMDEGFRKVVTLPGKKKSEFISFWKSLQPLSTESLTPENAIFLTAWADECQVDVLKARCEEYLVKKAPVDASSLKHAVTYNLEQRMKQCINVMTYDVAKYIDELEHLATEATKAQMEAFWPHICSAAQVKKCEMPPMSDLQSLWPFISAAVYSAKCFASAKSCALKRGARIALTTMVEKVKDTLLADGIPQLPLSVDDEEKYRNLVSGAINDIEKFEMDYEGLDAIEDIVKETFKLHALKYQAAAFLAWFEVSVKRMCLRAFPLRVGEC